jgi:hypothetical protein
MTAVFPSLVRFYSQGLIDSTLLQDQGIEVCVVVEGYYCFFSERSANGHLRVYVLDERQGLYLLHSHLLTQFTGTEELTEEQLERIELEWLPQFEQLAHVGACVVHEKETKKKQTPRHLSASATAAAEAAGASEEAAECFATFVDLAFLGGNPDCVLQYTAAGVRVGLHDPTDSFGEDNQYLDQLHALGLVRVQRQAGRPDVTLHFQQAALAPALQVALLPRFLTALLY